MLLGIINNSLNFVFDYIHTYIHECVIYMYYDFTYHSVAFYHSYNFRVLTSPNMSFFLTRDLVICKQDRSVPSFLNHTLFISLLSHFPFLCHITLTTTTNITSQNSERQTLPSHY